MTKNALLVLTLSISGVLSAFAQQETFQLIQYGKDKKLIAYYQSNPVETIDLEQVGSESLLSAIQEMESMNLEVYSESCRIKSVHPLILASYFGKRELVSFLLEKEEITADITLLSSALAASVHLNDWEFTKRFIDLGASVNSTCGLCYGASTLQMALGNECEPQMVEYFWKNTDKETLEKRDCRGRSTLFYAAGNPDTKYLKELLTGYKESLLETDAQGVSPLAGAITSGNVENARLILETLTPEETIGLDEMAKEHFPGGLLSAAVSSKNREMVSLIQNYIRPIVHNYIDLEMDINELDEECWTWVNFLDQIYLKFDEKGVGVPQLPIYVPIQVLQNKRLPTYDELSFWRTSILHYPESRALIMEKYNDEWYEMENSFARIKELYFKIESTHFIRFGDSEYQFIDLMIGKKTDHRLLDNVFGISLDMDLLLNGDVSKAPPHQIWYLNLTNVYTFDSGYPYYEIEDFSPMYLFEQAELVSHPNQDFWVLENGEPNRSRLVTLPTVSSKKSALKKVIAKDMTLENLPEGVEWVK